MADDPKPVRWFPEAQVVISFSVIFAFLVMCFLWSLYQPKLDSTQEKIVLLLVGALINQSGAVVQYFLNRPKDKS